MFIANTRPEDGPIFDYLNFLDGTEETFMEYVENVRERSLITTGVDVQPGDGSLHCPPVPMSSPRPGLWWWPEDPGG